jgi:hypothetical protein
MLVHGATTDDEVYCQFLRNERDRLRGDPKEGQLAALVSRPDFNDINQNAARRRFLFSVRWPLLAQLPDPLQWHSATMEQGDLEKLRLIRNCGWDDRAPDNILGEVRFPMNFDLSGQEKITAILQKITTAPDFDKTLVLVAQTTDGPFTILDGNHRATAMMVAERSGKFTEVNVKAYVGVSPRMNICIWCS